jgi:hypothetical protein
MEVIDYISGRKVLGGRYKRKGIPFRERANKIRAVEVPDVGIIKEHSGVIELDNAFECLSSELPDITERVWSPTIFELIPSTDDALSTFPLEENPAVGFEFILNAFYSM